MTPVGMMAFGGWLVFMGVAGFASRRLSKRPAQRSRMMLRTLQRYHLAASEDFYRTLSRIMIPVLVVAGVALIIIGVLHS